jgi:hypothetical protein
MRNVFALFALLLLTMTVGAQDGLTLTPLGTYATGAFDEGAAEIVAYDAATQTLFVVNGAASTVDLLDMADPTTLTLKAQIDASAYGDAATSVAVYNGLVAVAIPAEETGDNGVVAFFSADGAFLSQVTVGALPDMVTFNADGTKVVTANEGEPSDDYSIDPEGSVSIIDLSGGDAAALTDADVVTVGFADFNTDGARAAELPAEVRVFGPNATVAQDLEPEYVAIAGDVAYVTLQENNALAIIDLTAGSVVGIAALGFKDHMAEGNRIDTTDADGGFMLQNVPVLGMYQPDAIAAYTAPDGTVYLLTANEGDTRDYDGYSEEGEISELTLDAEVFPNAAELQTEEIAGKLEVVTSTGDTDGDGDLDALYLPGARSFTVWTTDGALVWDSGEALETITAEAYPDYFNSSNDGTELDDRSDNKGPEPEALTVGVIDGVAYAFVGLERIGGVMVYDLTDPTAPAFVTYANNRNFEADPETAEALDLGPEGVLFIPAADAPDGVTNLLVVANEISGTTTVFAVNR